MTEIKNKKIIVTGGTAGIGLATAATLLERGHKVFICGRKQDRLSLALNQLEKISGKENVSGIVCDVRDYEDVENMTTKADNFFDGIDVLVNSAGVAVIESFPDITSEEWKDTIDINLTGVFNCCKSVLPRLKESSQADIINLGSRAGRYAFAGGTAYNTAKFGLQGFSEALFLDLNQYGIGVSLVAPGTVGTGLGGTEKQDWHLQPEDIAKVIADIIESNSRANINWVEIRPSMRNRIV